MCREAERRPSLFVGSGFERGHGDALILRSVGGAETQIHRDGNVKGRRQPDKVARIMRQFTTSPEQNITSRFHRFSSNIGSFLAHQQPQKKKDEKRNTGDTFSDVVTVIRTTGLHHTQLTRHFSPKIGNLSVLQCAAKLQRGS